MKKCEDIQFLLTLYALDNLGGVSKKEVSKHLKECKKCKKEFNEIKQGLTIINDVLKVTSVDDQHLSEERYDAIIRSSKIKKTQGRGWVTKHRPALGVAASTLIVFGLTWAIVSSLQPMKSVEYQKEDSLREFAESFVLNDKLAAPKPVDVEFEEIDVCFAESGNMQSTDDNKAGEERNQIIARKVESQIAYKGIYANPNSGDRGEATTPANKKTASKPGRSITSFPESTLIDYGYVDLDIQGDLKRDNKPQSITIEGIDAVALTKSPVVLTGIYGQRTPGAKGAAMKKQSGDVDLPEEDKYAAEHAIFSNTKGNATKNKTALSEQKRLDKESEFSQIVAKESSLRRLRDVREKQKAYYPFSSTVGDDSIVLDLTLSGERVNNTMPAQPIKLAKPSTSEYRRQEAPASLTAVGGIPMEQFKQTPTVDKPIEDVLYEKILIKAEEICEEIEVFSELVADKEDVGEEILTRQSVIRATGVNPYVQTVDNAFSTFSIDVDTASYNLSRRYMLAGFLPPPEMVRTEEFVNSFDYHYVPAINQTFRIYTDISPSPFAHGQYMMRIGVKGKRLGREEQKQAILTLLVDTSGSMKRPDRIGLIKQSLKFLLEQLGENDKIAIVQYGTKARVVLEHTEVKSIDVIIKAIDSLQCGGATDMEDGMLRAYKVAAEGYVNNAENKVLLMSDGVANIGEGIAESILEKIRPYIKQGITCSIYGFGIGNYDDAMLEELANKGNGTYAYIGNLNDAKQTFSEESAATLHLIASDVKIQVEFSPGIVKQYRQLGYENRLLTQQDFRDDAVDAGEIGSGQSVTALYEMELEENKPMDPWFNSAAGLHSGDILAIVRVRYKDINTKEITEIEQKVRTIDIKHSFERMPTEYRLAVGVAEFAEQLRGSPHAQGSSFRDILKIIELVAQELPLDSKVQELKNFIKYAPSMGKQQL